MRNFIYFIYNPFQFLNKNKKHRANGLVVSMFLFLLIVVVLKLLSLYSFELLQVSYRSKISFDYSSLFFLKVVIIAPVFEEFTFRSFLKINKLSICFFLSGLTYTILLLLSNEYILLVTLSILIGVFGFLIIPKRKIQRIKVHKKRYNLFVYLSVILFGLIHLPNINFEHLSFLIIIIYLIPFIFGALIMSYLRLKYNLLTSIVFHSLINIIPFVIIFSKQLLNY